MGNEHILQIIIQVLLGLAVYSFMQYSTSTVHAPDVVNRRAKLICAAGLTLGVLGVWLILLEQPLGLALTIIGNFIAVATMIWLETQGRTARRSRTDRQ
jgi:hypothetical protein